RRPLALERGEVPITVRGQLEEVLLADVLERLRPEIAERGSLRHVAAEQRPRCLRKEDLAAMTGGADARGADDVEADVALISYRRLTRMQPHADLDVGIVRPWVLG